MTHNIIHLLRFMPIGLASACQIAQPTAPRPQTSPQDQVLLGPPPQASGAQPESQDETPAEPRPSLRDQVVKVALEQQGKPYVPGKQGPHQFDCSGLVWYSFEAAGVHFPRTSAEVMRRSFHAQAVDPKDLQPGDLLFYWFPNSRGIPEGHAAHVEIYVDSGLTIGADNEREGVRLEPIPYKALIGAARILPPED